MHASRHSDQRESQTSQKEIAEQSKKKAGCDSMQQREPDLLAGISTARKQQIGAAAAQSERIGEAAARGRRTRLREVRARPRGPVRWSVVLMQTACEETSWTVEHGRRSMFLLLTR